jgi:hypothetical protein
LKVIYLQQLQTPTNISYPYPCPLLLNGMETTAHVCVFYSTGY